MSVNIKSHEASMDGLYDNNITITIDNPCWVERAKNTALLVINTILRPLHTDEPLKRDEPLSLQNIAGEGQLAKCKTCLGWDIQTRSLQVLLPRGK